MDGAGLLCSRRPRRTCEQRGCVRVLGPPGRLQHRADTNPQSRAVMQGGETAPGAGGDARSGPGCSAFSGGPTLIDRPRSE